ALAGDPTSLAKRYEIPRAALAALRDESSTAGEKLAVIDKYLSDIGITSEVVGGSIPKASIAFNTLGASLEGLQTTIGSGLATALIPAAEGLTALSNAFQGINANEGLTALALTLIDVVGGTEASTAANTQFVSSLLSLVGVTTQAEQAARAKAESEQQAALATANIANVERDLAIARAEGRISAEEYAAKLTETQAALAAQVTAAGAGTVAYTIYSQAAQEAAARTADAGKAATDAAAAKLLAAANADTLAVAEQQLADQAMGAAQAVVDGGGNIEATAARLAGSSSLVDQLTAAYIRLLAAQQAAAIAGRERLAGQAAYTRDNTGGRGPVIGAPGRQGSGDPNAVLQFIKDQQAAAAATRDQNFALANQAGQISILQGELKDLTPGTAEYIKKQTDLLQLQNRATTAGGGRAGAAAKEQRSLLNAQEDYQQRAQDLAESHEERLGKIAEEGAKKRLEAERKFAQNQLDSRAGFYRSLAGIEDQDVAKDLSAKYEQAVQQAQEIARTKGADVADEFLAAQQQSIRDQADLQAEIADAEKNKDAGKAEYYRGLLKLQQEADAERLRQITESGDSLLAQQEAQYTEEELAYAKHLDELAETYRQKTADLGPGFAATLGSPPPTGSPAAAGTAPVDTTAAPATTAPVPQGATLVSDPNVASAVEAGLGRLEGRVGDLEAKLGDVVSAVEGVERAVKNIKLRSDSALTGTGG
ncbi:MAG: hypothetical protein IT546_06925, partial [Caulobacteraceae bacterium]|nr:hypothetical protein [Caulobacteraceae bacterium]